MQVRAKSALLSCVVLVSAASLAAQQGRGPWSWSQRRPSLQTLHSRTFTQRTAALQAPIEHVILLSVDGMMPDTYVHPDAHGLKVPTLRAMVRQGSSSEGVLGVFPTVTYPSHTSMVTGVNPGTHGIITNAQRDPLDNLHGAWRWYAEDIRVPTLWDAARAKGLTTALVFWPVTVGAKGNAVVPEFWRQVPGTVEDTKLNFALSTPGLLDTVAKRFPNFRPRFLPPRAEDEALTDIAIHVIEALKPNLLLLHIADVDHWEHDDGPFTGRVLPALETADEQIARVIAAAKKAGIWNQTALVVVSDHGFARTAHRVRPGVWLREKGFVKVEDRTIVGWKAYCLANGGSAYIYVKDPDDQETRKTLVEMFEQAVTRRDSGIRRVLTHEQIVRAGGDPAAFLALEAEEGWAIAGGVVGEAISPASNAAEHGYLPDRPEMRSSLVVYGPAIGSSKIENARMIDIAPTIARWLGLKLEKAEGTPLKIPLRRAVASP